jgi:predicted O-methyltransferase YrrM
VEIGTFRGAATVAIALGARASGRRVRVLTADLLRPGIGAIGDTAETKIGELRATFDAFSVGDLVHFVPGSSAELVADTDPQEIELLLLDGGGKIEADLALLWDRLASGCTIVIDDVDGQVFVRRSLRSAVVDQKHRISRLLVRRFVDAGLLVPRGSTVSTGWYEKGKAEATADEIRLLALPAYHELIKAPVEAGELGAARALLRHAAQRWPLLARIYRRLRPAALPAIGPEGS